MLGFRIWDSLDKRFLSTPEERRKITIFDDGMLSIYTHEPLSQEDLSRYIPMQSTGIFAWQEKEIFEGDVLFIYIDTPTFSNHYYLVESVKDFLLMIGKLENCIRNISNDGNIYECPALMDRLKEK